MRRAIVTGATGFVGANLAGRLAAEGHQVHLLVRPGYNSWRIERLIEHVRLHSVDLADIDALQYTIARISPEWVFHLAVYGAYPGQTVVRTMVQTNIMGTLNLIEASARAGAEVIVNTGSSSEYGFKDRAPGESDCAEPNSAYAVTKLSATLLCRELARRSGVRIPTLRLYSVYGPFEEPTRLIPRLLVRALDGRLPPLADPRTCRDFVYVDDVVDAYLRVAGQRQTDPGAIFNVGTGVQTSLAAIVDSVRRMLPVEDTPEWGTYADRAWDTHTWVADSTRIQRDLGWLPRSGLDEGLRAFVAWLQAHPEYLRRYRQEQSVVGG